MCLFGTSTLPKSELAIIGRLIGRSTLNQIGQTKVTLASFDSVVWTPLPQTEMEPKLELRPLPLICKVTGRGDFQPPK